MSAEEILCKIVDVRQRRYDRCIALQKLDARAISEDDIDVSLLELLEAELELARELETKENRVNGNG